MKISIFQQYRLRISCTAHINVSKNPIWLQQEHGSWGGKSHGSKTAVRIPEPPGNADMGKWMRHAHPALTETSVTVPEKFCGVNRTPSNNVLTCFAHKKLQKHFLWHKRFMKDMEMAHWEARGSAWHIHLSPCCVVQFSAHPETFSASSDVLSFSWSTPWLFKFDEKRPWKVLQHSVA